MSDNWGAVRELFARAVDCPPSKRLAFIRSAAPDPDVRRQVERLVEEHEGAGGFLESGPAIVLDAWLESGDKPAPSRLAPGLVLAGRFQIVAFIGAGGMGDVYKAEDLQTATPVALKVIRPAIASDPDAAPRFRQELALARKVTDRNVCRVFDVHGHTPSPDLPAPILFLTMELLEGQTLAQRLAGPSPLAPPDRMAIARQLVSAVAAAHQAGIVHRDLKSANVMLVPALGAAGQVRAVVMDFGLACPAASTGAPGEVIGTPDYMAPEQFAGHTTQASDVYSLGVVLYELVTGERPHGAAPPAPRTRARWLPRRWNRAIARCLAPDPSERFENAQRLWDLVAPGTRLTGTRFARWAAAIAACVLIAGLGTVLYPVSRRTGVETSVAVLGFKNLSGVAGKRYLSTALTMALDAELAAAKRIRVIPADDVARSKLELSLADRNCLPPAQAFRLHQNSGADLIVMGSYLAVESSRQLTLYINVENARTGRQVASITETGSEAELPPLVARTANRLRAELGFDDTTRQDPERPSSLPGSLEALRLYSEGVSALSRNDPMAARASLESAIAGEPGYALAHSALAKAWMALGYKQRAAGEAALAREYGSRLPREQKLLIEGSYWESVPDKAKAADAYRELLRLHPGNADYTLLLAGVETSTDALRTLATLPAAVRQDPRFDLAQAQAAHSANDYRQEQEAAVRAAAKGGASGAVLLVAAARLHEGWASWVLGQPKRAAVAYDDARRIYEQFGDWIGTAQALNGVAMVNYYSGNLQAARNGYEQALSVLRRIGSQYTAADALNGLAMVASRQGHLAEAAARYSESLAVCRDIRSPICIGKALNNLGNISLMQGRLGEARRFLQAALPQFVIAKGQYGQSFVLNTLGDLYAAAGDLDQAEITNKEALAISRRLKDRTNEAAIQVSIAAILRERGRLGEARRLLTTALATQLAVDEKDSAAETRLAIAALDMDESRFRAAEKEARDALAAFETSGRKEKQASAYAVLLTALVEQHRLTDAARAAGIAAAFARTSENKLARLHLDIALARETASRGNTAQASAMLARSAGEASRAGLVGLQLEALGAAVRVRGQTMPAAAVRALAASHGFLRIANECRPVPARPRANLARRLAPVDPR